MRNFHKPERSEVFSQNGMIATSHPLAAKIGLDTMSRGGNAIDAAISAALMLTLCEPQSTGLYGDAFVILKSKKSDKLIGINGSGSSPRAISSDLLLEKGLNKIPINSVHSITLPGAVALFEELALKFSNLGLTELCRAPIKYAEEGVVVSPRVAFDWRLNNSKFSQTTKKFYLVNGKVPEVGSIFRAPKQAEVLRKIQKSGSKGFYQSEVAEDFVRSLQRLGGVHTLDDFAKVTFEYVDPIFSNFQDGSQLFELPPNGQGITAIMIRKLMEICNIQEHSPNSVNRVHLEAEIAKLAYTARNRLIGDPQFSQIKEHFFLESAFLEEIAQGISVDKLIDARDIQYFDEKQKDTVLISAADQDGNAISLIFSSFHEFGAGKCSERYGLIFHNRGAGFVLEKNHPNELEGNKRPLHTIIPAILKDKNDMIMAFGVMGGNYQPYGHARILSNLFDYNMDPQSAINFPRSFFFNGVLELEEGYRENVAEALIRMGHKIVRPIAPIGGAQLVICDPSGVLIGASDPRKDGCALGI